MDIVLSTVDDIASDGRHARSQRTRAEISNALLQLLEEGHHQPAVQQVAKRANVSVRAIYHHFDDIEGLYTELVDMQSRRIMPLLTAVSKRRSTVSKARQLIEMHDDLYTLAAPLHNGIRFSVAARGSQKIFTTLQQMRLATSTQIQQSFKSELGLHHNPYDAISRLEAVISFEMWDHFRRVQGCSRHATRTHMLALLMAELDSGH